MYRLLFALAALELASCATRPYTASAPETRAAKETYSSCFEEKGARMASNKTDSAIALAQSVARQCQDKEEALRWSLTQENQGTPLPAVYVNNLVARIRQMNTEAAADAFMIARSATPR